MRAKIIAVDFDGTLIEEGKWPGIGATNEKVLNYCKDEQEKGARIILWTNRVGKPLETAIKWCGEHDKVLEDMYNPDGGLVALAAKDYYYQNYASEEERKNMDREDKIQTAVAIIFMIVFWVAVGFAVISSLI